MKWTKGREQVEVEGFGEEQNMAMAKGQEERGATSTKQLSIEWSMKSQLVETPHLAIASMRAAHITECNANDRMTVMSMLQRSGWDEM